MIWSQIITRVFDSALGALNVNIVGDNAGMPTIQGSLASPLAISATTGITPPGGYNQLMYIQGSSGNVDITKNPQIVAGVNDGETLELRGCNASQKVLIEDGTGLSLNGSFNMGLNDSITLRWDLTNWVEVSRRENA